MRNPRPFLPAAAAAIAFASAAALAGAGDDAAQRRRDTALVDLGRQLFFDPAASRTGRVACSKCHIADHGFSDAIPESEDEFRRTRRHSQSVVDLAALPAGTRMHWDGEFAGVRDLLAARLRLVEEAAVVAFARRLRAAMNAARDSDALDEETRAALTSSSAVGYGSLSAGPHSFPDVSARLASGGLYREGFLAAFGSDEATLPRTLDALEAYVASIRTARNAFDRHLAGERDALPADAKRGLELFEGKAGCSTCHTTAPRDGRAPLADGKFHDTGIAALPAGSRPSLPARVVTLKVDRGRAEQTLLESDRMTFRTPSLRDVARRGPFMHDGSIRTLAEVVDYYDGGGTPHPELSPHIKRIGLTAADKRDLVAFLECLTGEERAGLADPPADLGRETRIQIVDLEGRPLGRLAISIHPAGERYRGVAVPSEPVEARTDEKGWARFPFPPTTHARLDPADHKVESGRLLPRGADQVALMAVPREKFVVRALVPEDLFPESLEVLQLRRVREGASGSTRSVELVRRIAPGEALYAGDAPREGGSAFLLGANVRAMRGTEFLIGRSADVDTGPGAATLVDLRARSDRITVDDGEGGVIEVPRNLPAREIEAAVRATVEASRKPAEAGPERR